ncbi:MAG TPA: HAD hydrolase-like protein [Oculatellaceae cyanobacterium]|jgi:phosphoglycolate phosphatase-like HAD superfamily hydrolase
MPTIEPTVLALDFDGVLCDGMIEYFQTSWRTYCQIWTADSQIQPENLAENFYKLRPVIEVGWEMPLLLRALILGVPEEKIWQDWVGVAQKIVLEENLNAAEIGLQLDQIRDRWIAEDLDSWLALHRFYPGIVERLRSLLASSVQPVIVTTKEGRFAQQLLQQQNINMPTELIIGKEVKRSKHQTLRELLTAFSVDAASIWFVEDRLKTLQSVEQQPDLEAVKLFLADWGYNTPAQQASIRLRSRIKLLSLSQFAQDFSAWC